MKTGWFQYRSYRDAMWKQTRTESPKKNYLQSGASATFQCPVPSWKNENRVVPRRPFKSMSCRDAAKTNANRESLAYWMFYPAVRVFSWDVPRVDLVSVVRMTFLPCNKPNYRASRRQLGWPKKMGSSGHVCLNPAMCHAGKKNQLVDFQLLTTKGPMHDVTTLANETSDVMGSGWRRLTCTCSRIEFSKCSTQAV